MYLWNMIFRSTVPDEIIRKTIFYIAEVAYILIRNCGGKCSNSYFYIALVFLLKVEGLKVY